jgi:hypothetical protein
MNYLTGKHLDRRTFLKNMSATIGLPFLDAMIPIGKKSNILLKEHTENTRLVAIEFVHGMAGLNQDYGGKHNLFIPATVGKNFPIADDSALKPLEPWREYLTVVTNTDVRMAEAYRPEEIGGDHFRSSAVFLTQSHPKQTQGSDLFVGISLDQLQAKKYGDATSLPSMQLCIESMDQAGGCDYNYSCAYTDSISWASPNEPLPMIRNPRVAFDRLFGSGGSLEERTQRRNSHKSILDWVTDEVSILLGDLGQEDQVRMEKYLDNVREIERRIQKVEMLNTNGSMREIPEAPPGVPDSFEEHMKLMFDLQLLAFETDMTRVISFKTGRDASNRTYPESGTDRAFHPASHHGNSPEAVLHFNKINRYHVSMLPYFLEKLKNTIEGNTHLLDKTVIIYGSPMSDANVHNHRRCPLVLLGKGNGLLEGNLHLKALDGTPMANAFLSLLQGLGHDMEMFGDSNGTFPLKYSQQSNILIGK